MLVIDAADGKISIETCPLESIDSHLLAEELTAHVRRRRARPAQHRAWSRPAAPRTTCAWACSTSRSGTGAATCRASSRPAAAASAGSFATRSSRRWWPRTATRVPPWRVAENKVAALTTPKTISVCKCQSELDEIGAIIGQLEQRPRVRHRDDAGHPGAVPPHPQDRRSRRSAGRPARPRRSSTTSPPSTRPSASSRAARPSARSAWAPPATSRARRASSIRSSACSGVKAGETTPDEQVHPRGGGLPGRLQHRPGGQDRRGGPRQRRGAAASSGCSSGTRRPAAKAASRDGGRRSSRRAATPEPLEKIAAREQQRAARGYKGMLMVCTGTGCVAAKGFDLRDQLQRRAREARPRARLPGGAHRLQRLLRGRAHRRRAARGHLLPAGQAGRRRRDRRQPPASAARSSSGCCTRTR